MTTNKTMHNFKSFILKYQNFFSLVYRCAGFNKIKGSRSNTINFNSAFIKNSQFDIRGKGNKIIIKGDLTRIINSHFYISGNNCTIIIGSGCCIRNTEFYIEDDNGTIQIDNHVTIGSAHLAVIEGTSILIGKNCLFSSNITLRTGDSHSIISLHNRERINPSASIEIDEHVWLGHSVTILKGCHVSKNSIIATGAILTNNQTYYPNTIIAGIPAKTVKTNVDWTAERITIASQVAQI